MIFELNTFRRLLAITLLTLIVINFYGCGGGDIRAISLSNPQTLIGEGEVLGTAKNLSTKLHIESSIINDEYKSIRVEINVTDNYNQPLSNVQLSISIIDSRSPNFYGEVLTNKYLITNAVTNEHGAFSLSLEVAKEESDLLLVLNTFGAKNDIFFSLDEKTSVTHNHYSMVRPYK